LHGSVKGYENKLDMARKESRWSGSWSQPSDDSNESERRARSTAAAPPSQLRWFGSSTSSEGDDYWRDTRPKDRGGNCGRISTRVGERWSTTPGDGASHRFHETSNEDQIMDHQSIIDGSTFKRLFVCDQIVKRKAQRGTDNTGIFGEGVAFLYLMKDYLTNQVPELVKALYVTQNVFNNSQLLLIAPRALAGWMSGSAKVISFEDLTPDDLELSLFVIQWLNDGETESGCCWDMAMFYFKEWEEQPNFIETEGMDWRGYFHYEGSGSGLAKTLGRLRTRDITAGVTQFVVGENYELISRREPDDKGICPTVGLGDVVCIIEVKSTIRSDSFIIHMSYNQMLLMSKYKKRFLLLCVQGCPTLFDETGGWSSRYDSLSYTVIQDPLTFFDEKMTIYKRELKLRYTPEVGSAYKVVLEVEDRK